MLSDIDNTPHTLQLQVKNDVQPMIKLLFSTLFKTQNYLTTINWTNFSTKRKLITLSEGLLILNFSPSIPHQILVDILQNIVKIGSPNSEYNHVMSFRRQVYIEPPEDINMSDSIKTSFSVAFLIKTPVSKANKQISLYHNIR